LIPHTKNVGQMLKESEKNTNCYLYIQKVFRCHNLRSRGHFMNILEANVHDMKISISGKYIEFKKREFSTIYITVDNFMNFEFNDGLYGVLHIETDISDSLFLYLQRMYKYILDTPDGNNFKERIAGFMFKYL
jgi:hypothetical protein